MPATTTVNWLGCPRLLAPESILLVKVRVILSPSASVVALTNRAAPVWPAPVADQALVPMPFVARTCTS